MKNIIFLILSVVLSLNTDAQTAVSDVKTNAKAQPSKMNFGLKRKLKADGNDAREISVLVKGNVDIIKAKTIELGGVFKNSAGDIASIRIPLNKIELLAKVAEVQRIESSYHKLVPMNDQAIRNNHALEVQNGFGLPQGYDGTGVVVGIIDEGIDYTHPDFRDEFGNTRIKFLWDQSIVNINPATQPQPYGYGKEFVGNQIDTSTQHYDSPFGHGTHVAGIACGNGLAVNNYKGMAPKSDMIVVKANLHQPDGDFLSSLVDAIKYIFDKADDLGQPAVINISLGTYFGSHDGKDIQAQYIDNLITTGPGRVIVASAGNAGTAPIHLGYDLSPDTNFTWLQFTSDYIYIQAWGDSGQFENSNFSIGLDRVEPDYHSVASMPFVNIQSQLDTVVVDTLFDGANRLGTIYRYAEYFNGRYSFEYVIYPDSTMNISGNDTSRYLWSFKTFGSGRMDAWSLEMVFDNIPDTTLFPAISQYKKPDGEQTIVSSFTCSDKVITVGSHINRNYYTNANFAITRDTSLVVGELSSFSSRGPTRDGRIKPDITATGEWILSAGTQSELNILSATEPTKVAAGKKHKRSSGTSMSSPMVAGICALYLQKNPTATWLDVKTAILNCADQDNFTGSSLPNNDWGYGKVNAYSAIRGCNIGIDEMYANVDFSIYPNPSSANTNLQYDLASIGKYGKATITISNSIGSVVKTITLKTIANSIEIPSDEFHSGIYFCTLKIDDKTIRSQKLVIL
jgi:subtilisin family serine protease